MYKSEHIVLSVSSLVKLENLDHDEKVLLIGFFPVNQFG